jgi:O-antigen/teichoic acid export membrane protein
VNLGALLVARVAMARFMGPAEYGAFGIGLNCATVLYKTGTVGLVPATQYYGGKPQGERAGFFRTVLLLGLVVSGLLTMGALTVGRTLFASYWETKPIGFEVFLIFAACVPVLMLGDLLSILLIPREKMWQFNVTQLMTGCLLPVLFMAGILVLAPLPAAITAQVLAWVAVFAYGAICFRREIYTGAFDGGTAMEVVKYGLKTWPYVLLAVGAARFAVVYGASLVTAADAGRYIVAMNVVDGLFGFHGALGQLLLSKVSKQETAAYKGVLAAMRISMAALLVLCLLYVSCGRPVFNALFGAEYQGAFVVSAVLLIMRACHAQHSIAVSFLAGNGMPGRNTITLAGEMLALLVSVPLLAERYGVIGLAWAAALSALVGLVISTVQVVRVMKCAPSDLFVLRRSDLEKVASEVRKMLPAWKARG